MRFIQARRTEYQLGLKDPWNTGKAHIAGVDHNALPKDPVERPLESIFAEDVCGDCKRLWEGELPKFPSRPPLIPMTKAERRALGQRMLTRLVEEHGYLPEIAEADLPWEIDQAIRWGRGRGRVYCYALKSEYWGIHDPDPGCKQRPRRTHSRGVAWDLVPKPEGHNPWRRHHTETYWCWYREQTIQERAGSSPAG